MLRCIKLIWVNNLAVSGVETIGKTTGFSLKYI